MTVDLDFELFMRCGQIGPLKLGCARKTVLDVLGQPDHSSMKDVPVILKYKNIQFTFNKSHELAMIVLSFSSTPLEWHLSMNVIGQVPYKGMSLEAFRSAYASLSDCFKINEELSFSDQVTLTVQESGVDVLFVEGVLEKVVCSSLARLRNV